METKDQLKILEQIHGYTGAPVSFRDKLAEWGYNPLNAQKPEILQVNLGQVCNQSCKHCHVYAGSDRKETMNKTTMEQCLAALDRSSIPAVDITGGAPEMNEQFKWFVRECRKRDKHVMARSNLTIFFHNDQFKDLPQFYADHQVEINASLPFYSAYKTNKMRGSGVFEQSIKALQLLNNLGYGKKDGLILNLVYNPPGAFLPGSQEGLEQTFKEQLHQQYGITFNQLFTITNMPISRYLEYLIDSENLIPYMDKLITSFNPAAVPNVMCRNTLSVRWDGYLFDCDFNQMLDLKLDLPQHQHISQFDEQAIANRNVNVSQHCYGCTAGSGSSCGGATVE